MTGTTAQTRPPERRRIAWRAAAVKAEVPEESGRCVRSRLGRLGRAGAASVRRRALRADVVQVRPELVLPVLAIERPLDVLLVYFELAISRCGRRLFLSSRIRDVAAARAQRLALDLQGRGEVTLQIFYDSEEPGLRERFEAWKRANPALLSDPEQVLGFIFNACQRYREPEFMRVPVFRVTGNWPNDAVAQ